MLPGLFFHYALLLVVSLGLGACVCGWIALRRSVNTGVAGLNRAVAALVLGVSLTLEGRKIQENADSVRGIFSEFGSAMDDMQRAAEIDGLTLPGTGQATLTLQDVTFQIPLDGCGLTAPVPGYHLVGRGSTTERRSVRLHFASVFLGVQGEAISVRIGSQSYVLEAEELFDVAPDGRTLRAAGTFRVPMSDTEAPGTLEASCSA